MYRPLRLLLRLTLPPLHSSAAFLCARESFTMGLIYMHAYMCICVKAREIMSENF